VPTPKLSEDVIKAAQDALQKHGSIQAAAKALKIARSTLQNRVKRNPDKVAKAQGKGKTLADFRAEHDKDYIIPTKIRAGLADLGDGWEYEMPFAKIAGVSLGDLANYREAFADHVVVVGGRSGGKRVWAGTKSLAAKLREMAR
jgi:hypothetical protein